MHLVVDAPGAHRWPCHSSFCLGRFPAGKGSPGWGSTACPGPPWAWGQPSQPASVSVAHRLFCSSDPLALVRFSSPSGIVITVNRQAHTLADSPCPQNLVIISLLFYSATKPFSRLFQHKPPTLTGSRAWRVQPRLAGVRGPPRAALSGFCQQPVPPRRATAAPWGAVYARMAQSNPSTAAVTGEIIKNDGALQSAP